MPKRVVTAPSPVSASPCEYTTAERGGVFWHDNEMEASTTTDHGFIRSSQRAVDKIHVGAFRAWSQTPVLPSCNSGIHSAALLFLFGFDALCLVC